MYNTPDGPPEIPLSPVAFPSSATAIHLQKDVEKTLAIGVALHCFKKGVAATPSVQIGQRDDGALEIYASRDGEFIYFWGTEGGRLFAIKLADVIASARYALLGSKEKKPKVPKAEAAASPTPTPAPEPPPASSSTTITRRKLVCVHCGETDIDICDEFATHSRNGWLLKGGESWCPVCAEAWVGGAAK